MGRGGMDKDSGFVDANVQGELRSLGTDFLFDDSWDELRG